MTTDVIQYANLIGVIAIAAFLWNLSRDINKDMANLRERMARLEGVLEGLKGAITGKTPA